jgi:hypothetical protein
VAGDRSILLIVIWASKPGAAMQRSCNVAGNGAITGGLEALGERRTCVGQSDNEKIQLQCCAQMVLFWGVKKQ